MKCRKKSQLIFSWNVVLATILCMPRREVAKRLTTMKANRRDGCSSSMVGPPHFSYFGRSKGLLFSKSSRLFEMAVSQEKQFLYQNSKMEVHIRTTSPNCINTFEFSRFGTLYVQYLHIPSTSIQG